MGALRHRMNHHGGGPPVRLLRDARQSGTRLQPTGAGSAEALPLRQTSFRNSSASGWLW